MRDPFTWSVPFGRLFGVNIRIHVFFPFVLIAMVARAAFEDKAIPGSWIDVTIIMTLLFLTVLAHEFGHCFGARWVNGDAQEVLLWPLGGLARVDHPHTPRAEFITAAAGPAVNLVLAVVSLIALQVVYEHPLQPTWHPIQYNGRWEDGLVHWNSWHGQSHGFSPYSPVTLLGWLFWVNYMQFLLNMLLIGFPLDGGRIFRSLLWPSVGYRVATLYAVFAGFIVMFIVALYGLAFKETLALCLAVFIYVSCRQEWIILETGGEDSAYGDFSQGYTSLEREEPRSTAPPRPRLNRWQRWQQRRLARRLLREQETREADERRFDQLLEKISTHGKAALTDEELRFMKHHSERFKRH
jgi:stage IV sporulation protein FB